ncbi:RNA helicase [Rhizina undulata]
MRLQKNFKQNHQGFRTIYSSLLHNSPPPPPTVNCVSADTQYDTQGLNVELVRTVPISRSVFPLSIRSFNSTSPLFRGKSKSKPKAPKLDIAPPAEDRSYSDNPPAHKTETYKKVHELLHLLNPPNTGTPYYTEPEFWLTETKLPVSTLQDKFSKFAKTLLRTLRHGDFSASGSTLPSINQLESIFKKINDDEGEEIMKGYFMSYLGKLRPDDVIASQHTLYREKEKAADMRFPHEQFPSARQMDREWHLHVGPTNSGKTYQALKRLEEAGNGMYAGPLRLLAHEIFERMNAKGIPCNLITGDDQRTVDENALVTSSTVEMADMSREMEVAVLDEIQMIGDEDRGWAWSAALLGIRAKEVHLCGEERTVEIISKLADLVGDKLHVHRYDRLGPLEVMPESLDGRFDLLEKGDCVVTFSRKNIFALKKTIEQKTGKRCAVVYGGLPPETRSDQAKLFNDPDNEYEILVASDAVGMGLNLSIKRVIFETTVKYNGKENEIISVPQIKQIAGRAGRFRVAVTKDNVNNTEATTSVVAAAPAAPPPGLTTTLFKHDLRVIKKAMQIRVPQIKTAGLLPSQRQIEEFEALFDRDTKFSGVLRSLDGYMTTTGIFHSCALREQIKVATLIDDIRGLSIGDRIQFCNAPISRELSVQRAATSMARVLGEGTQDGSILSIPGIDLEALDEPAPTTMAQLHRLEALHKVVILYIWLAYRFPTAFSPIETAISIKGELEHLIDEGLRNVRFTYKHQRGRTVTSTEIPEGVLPNIAQRSTITSFADDTEVEAGESNQPRTHHPPSHKDDELEALDELWEETPENSKYEDITDYTAAQACFHCGKPGHIKRKCPQFLKQNICFQCGKKGHLAADCPVKKAREKRSANYVKRLLKKSGRL